MDSIVITGGMGFIFSHVTEYFIEKGYHVHVIDNLSEGSHPELIPVFKDLAYEHGGMFTFIELDVQRQEVIPIIKTINPVYIVHAAAISDVDHSIKEPLQTITKNNAATINVFEAARKCSALEKLLYVSTDEVYGECYHPKREDEIIFPKNPYSCSKAFGSLLRLAYDNTYPELADKTVETRFCNVFGERQDERKIIPAIRRAIEENIPVQLHNDGRGYRQFIHVSEIPRIIDTLLEKGHRTYNVTTGEGFTVDELCKMASILTKKDVPIEHAQRPGMDMKYQMSGDRLRKEFGWRPSRSFESHFEEYLCQ